MKKLLIDVYFQLTSNYTARTEQFNGDEYVVVPVTMMVQGVHSGSHGAILHTIDELGKFPESWNGIPLTVGHPQVDGQYVSATSPQILSEWSVGSVFNTHVEGEDLKAEAWINKEDIIRIDSNLLERINNGEVIEVSVGVFSDEEPQSGIFNNEEYTAVAHNHVPNHLALLPDEVGACSINDGCGIRVNKKGGKMAEKKTVPIVNDDNEIVVMKELNRKQFSVNATGFYELSYKVMDALDAKDGNGFTYYLEEMFENELIFRERNYGTNSTKYYKQSYQENAAGEVELTGEAVQVKKEISYPNVIQMNAEGTKRKRTKFNTNNSKIMADVKKLADGLIANAATTYNEDDRGWLEGLSEEQLTKMSPVTVEKEVPAVVTNEQIMSAFTESMKTPEDFLKVIPESMRDQFQSGLAMQANAKTKMVEGIMANTDEGLWKKEELEAMSMDAVTKVYKTCGIQETSQTDYSAMGANGIKVNAEPEVAPLAPIGVEFETAKN
jgi:hypothetical protein